MISPTISSIVAGAWAVFIIYWVVSARGTKKDVAGSRTAWKREAGIRLLMVAVIVALIAAWRSGLHVPVSPTQRFGPLDASVGAALCIAGVALAIWARYFLGANWSSMPAMKEGHELVTTGPYRYVRHPIYTGILLATLGTALAVGVIWLLGVVAAAVVFVLRIRTEERFMERLFPDRYPAYVRRTKRLIPFIW